MEIIKKGDEEQFVCACGHKEKMSAFKARDVYKRQSQFFIMHETSPHLDGSYAAFGKVTDGMDVVNKIAETATDYSDRPLETQRMKKVTVDTMGTEYPEPEKR